MADDDFSSRGNDGIRRRKSLTPIDDVELEEASRPRMMDHSKRVVSELQRSSAILAGSTSTDSDNNDGKLSNLRCSIGSQARVRFSEDLPRTMPSSSASSASVLRASSEGSRRSQSLCQSPMPQMPQLSIDTSGSGLENDVVVGRAMHFPTSLSPVPASRESSVSPPNAQNLLSPPTPKAGRSRGYSLRRMVFNRTLQPHSVNDYDTGFELPSDAGATAAAGPSDSTLEIVPISPTDKSDATITVSPQTKDEGTQLFISDKKKNVEPDFSNLPNYESWAMKKSFQKSLFHKIRDTLVLIRKAILKVQEIPPSKNGRHVNLDLTLQSNQVDERTGKVYVDNSIRSSRYTLWNFFPKQTIFQFGKLANFYFLIVSILQMIPSLSTTGTYTTIVPLMFFIGLSMAKEGWEDYKRHGLDKEENNREVLVLYGDREKCAETSNESEAASSVASLEIDPWVQTKWQNVKVGNVVKLERNDIAPADLLLLHSDSLNNVAYIETMALDGETNLKNKSPLPVLAKNCKSLERMSSCSAHFVVEDPNLDLYNFDGKVTVNEETLPLTNNEIIYRGSILRNTPSVIGLAIYTGEESKIRMNANKNSRSKAPSLQRIVNHVVIVIVVFVILLAIFNSAAYVIWSNKHEEKAWYLSGESVPFIQILTSFIIMFNTMIPLSLYVSMEITKLFQLMFLNDIDMYDPVSDTPLEARTSTINEELGQVSYIFSDKTGTLTNNSMKFRKVSIAGTAWLHDSDLQEETLESKQKLLHKKRSKGKKPLRKSIGDVIRGRASTASCKQDRTTGVARSSSVKSNWRSSARPNKPQHEGRTEDMLRYIQRKPQTAFAQQVRFFLLSLAVCHTCQPEVSEDGDIDYQAASPDELALVTAAKEMGYIFVDRQASTITVKVPNVDGEPIAEVFEILDVIEFSSARKRMSVILRMPDHRICVFCKGADTIISSRLRQSTIAIDRAQQVERRLNERRSMEAQEVIRRRSSQIDRSDITRKSFSLARPSIGGLTRPSMQSARLRPIRDEVDSWLRDRETDVDSKVDDSVYYTPRPSSQFNARRSEAFGENRGPGATDLTFTEDDELVEEALVLNEQLVFERCFQHINDFASEGLRTLLYGYRFLEDHEYQHWKKLFSDATTSLVDRQKKVEQAAELIEQNFELSGATAIEDKLQEGVPEAIDKLRRANIKLWMLTGDKRETAINIGYSCRLIKNYSTITILDSKDGLVDQTIAAAELDIRSGSVAHSVVVVDGRTLADIETNEAIKKLFVDLAVLADSVICCRASPSQKASLVSEIRKKVKHAVTLAIGDGANDIAMIQEAHVGIGIAGKEGLQAARSSDYSIGQFRFLSKLLLVHGRWNYIRTSKYVLGTFWKEMLFYLTQALYQRWGGYTGTSLYESWSMSMFNTLFTSLPVIILGIFEKDLSASTLLAVPELYRIGQRNGGFNFQIYLYWMFTAAAEAVIIYFSMYGLYGMTMVTATNDLYSMGVLTFTACVVMIAFKLQLLEMHYRTIVNFVAVLLSVGGWWLFNVILSAVYQDNVEYDVKDGLLYRFGRNLLWWTCILLIVVSTVLLEIVLTTLRIAFVPTDVDIFQEFEQDQLLKKRFEEASSNELQLGWDRGDKKSSFEITREEAVQAAREEQVQALLDRPRVMEEGLASPFGSSRVDIEHTAEDECRDVNRPSFEIQELLKRGFGSIRKGQELK